MDLRFYFERPLQISADFETALYARLALKVSADASLRVTEVPASGSNFGTLVKLQRYPQNISYIPACPVGLADRTGVVEPDLRFGRLP